MVIPNHLQRAEPNPEVTKSDPHNTMAAPRNLGIKVMNQISDKG